MPGKWHVIYSRRLPSLVLTFQLVFTARRYASAVYAVVVSVRMCVCACVSHSGIVSKRLNVGLRK